MNKLAKEIFRLLDSWISLLKTAKKVYKWRRIPIDAIEITAKTIIEQINAINEPNSEEHKPNIMYRCLISGLPVYINSISNNVGIDTVALSYNEQTGLITRHMVFENSLTDF